MSKPKDVQIATLRRIVDSIDDDVLNPDYPIELVHEELREAGGDPEAIGREGAAFVKALLDKQRNAWRDEARRALVASRARIAEAKPVPRGSRQALLDRVSRLQANPRFAGQLSAAFRKRVPEEASTGELASLLDQFEALRLAAGLPADDDDGDDGGGDASS